MAFILFSALFPNAKCEAKLENPPKEELARQVANFSHILSANIYNYVPVDYKKIQALVPKASDFSPLSKTTLSKIAELVKPAITLQLTEPSDESQLKKFKTKQKALEEISIAAYLHVVFCQVYPQTMTSTGSPAKPEVRLASNLPEWQIVKKIDVAKAEPKEVFMTLASIYNSLHVKFPSLSSAPLTQNEPGRKSYSVLLQNLPAISGERDFVSEWSAFETFANAGFPPVPSTETIGELYPEIKIPKPRGNFGSKKK